GNQRAVQVLAGFVRQAAGYQLRDPARYLCRAAVRLKARDDADERVFLALEKIRALIPDLAASAEEGHPQLARELAGIVGDKTITTELVERIVAGTARDEDRNTARLSGQRGADLLCGVIDDPGRPATARAAA